MVGLTVQLTEREVEYLLAFKHLRAAERLSAGEKQTAEFDFLPPDVETRIIEAVMEELVEATVRI